MVKHDLSILWIKCDHFDLNWMIYGVGCTDGFNIDVWCILPNLMDYENSYLSSWGVGWRNYASKSAYESILSAYVKWNV